MVADPVVVTGAASGIGRATVELMRDPGSMVIGVDLGGPPPELEAADGVEWVRGDVTEGETWVRVRDHALRHDPQGATRLVACAGNIVVAPFLQTTIQDWQRILDVNVLGVVRAMQALMPDMIARGRGAVAVVCSVDSLYVEDDMSVYSASKAALLQVVRSAALEHSRDGLRVNAVCPGAVDTPLFGRAMAETPEAAAARAAVVRRIPTGQVLQPAEVASVLRFLVSPEASGLSGAAVTVDGGLTATYDYDGSRLTGNGSGTRISS